MSVRRAAWVITLALLVLVAVALLAGCLPALAPTIERMNGDVQVVVTANRDVWDASVSIIGAVSDDPRCVIVGVNGFTDSWCWVGDLAEGETVVIRAVGDRVGCTAAGYIEESLRVGSYRPFACRVAGR